MTGRYAISPLSSNPRRAASSRSRSQPALYLERGNLDLLQLGAAWPAIPARTIR